MKGYSTFPKVPASDFLVSYQDTRWEVSGQVCRGYVKYTVWRHISNNHENIANIMSTSCGVHVDRYKDLMEEDGT